MLRHSSSPPPRLPLRPLALAMEAVQRLGQASPVWPCLALPSPWLGTMLRFEINFSKLKKTNWA